MQVQSDSCPWVPPKQAELGSSPRVLVAASEHVVPSRARWGHRCGPSAQSDRTGPTQMSLWPLGLLSLEARRLGAAGLLHVPGGKRQPRVGGRGGCHILFPDEQP